MDTLFRILMGIFLDVDLLLCALFPILKLCNVITWSWGIVLIPIYVFLAFIFGMISVIIYELD